MQKRVNEIKTGLVTVISVIGLIAAAHLFSAIQELFHYYVVVVVISAAKFIINEPLIWGPSLTLIVIWGVVAFVKNEIRKESQRIAEERKNAPKIVIPELNDESWRAIPHTANNSLIKVSPSYSESKKVFEESIFFERKKEVENELLASELFKVVTSSSLSQKNSLPSPVLSRILRDRPKTKSEFSRIAGAKETNKFAGNMIKEIIIFDLCTASHYFGKHTKTEKLSFLKDAVKHSTQIIINYNSQSSGTGERLIQPIYMNSDYVWAKCLMRNELRCYKVLNIKEFKKASRKAG